jgi:hypothetical protein
MKKRMIVMMCALVLMVSTVWGLERAKPIPLKELQNKNGPSYVPIPYPQKRKDIITDMKHQLSRFMKNNKPFNSKQYVYEKDNTSRYYEKYLKGVGSISVGTIVKVVNFSRVHRFEFNYLIELIDPDNTVKMSIALEDSGLLLGSGFIGQGGFLRLNEQFNRQRDVIQHIVDKASMLNISRQELNGAEYVFYPGFSDLTAPARRVVKNNVMYLISPRMQLYRGQKEGVERQKLLKTHDAANEFYFPVGDKVMLVDTINEQIYSLEEIK